MAQRGAEGAKVVGVVSEGNGRDFGGGDGVKVGNVSGGGDGVTENMLGLGEDLGDVVTEVGGEGGVRFPKA